ncbi:MAG: RNA polymerase sigma factor [Chlorobi bacterium]|jgi:RNA polymerase sigma-70 factor (ECF subfamily)|nr:RNA polymerase sigma factor [Chlorobiota bacterium]
MGATTTIRKSELPDNDLFMQAKEGNVEAFNALFYRYERKVYVYCMKVLMDEDQAHDAFQEAFMRLYQHRQSYDGRNFMVWFFTIVRNVCLNMKRNRKTTVPFETSEANVSDAEIRDVVLYEQVAAALNKLPHDYREAIVLYEYDGYSYQEIAEIINASIATVKIRIFRARKMLRTILYPVVHDHEL